MRRRSSLLVSLAVLAAAAAAGTPAEDATRAAREALAGRLGEDPARITVARVEPASWPDWSLGCAEASSDSAESVEGHRVFLRVGPKVYIVNVAGSQVRVCTSFRASGALTRASAGASSMQQKPQPEPSDPASQSLVAHARADLQKRLSLKPEDIVLLEFKAVVWPDSSLGCPRPGMAYTQVQRDGVLIRFEAQGGVFEYHGGGGRPPFLCEHPAD